MAGSTFRSQNVQNTRVRTIFGSPDVEILKSKVLKTGGPGPLFGSCDAEKVHAVVAGSTFPSQNVQSTGFGPFLEVQMLKKCTSLWREAPFEVTLHYSTLHSSTLHYTKLHYTTLH